MNVVWRSIRRNDLKKIMKWRMSPDVSKYMYTDPVITLEQQERWYAEIQSDNCCEYYIISAEGIDIGVVYFTNISRVHSRCDWGYYIAEESFRGKGLGTILECNIYDYGFDELGLHKICCEVLSSNSKVISIHEKFGSEIEGTRKQHIFKKGEFHDIVEMAITKEKWKLVREKYEYKKVVIEKN